MSFLSFINRLTQLEWILILVIVFLFMLGIVLTFVIKHYYQKYVKAKDTYAPLESLTKDINEGFIQLVNASDVGMITLDSNFKIAFKSESFKLNFQDYFMTDLETLEDIDKDLYNTLKNADNLNISDIEEVKTIHVKDKFFEYHFKKSNTNSIVYFYDVTERENAKADLQSYTLCIGYVSIDITEIKGVNKLVFNKITADIYSRVENYLYNFNCQIAKLDDEHMVFITNYEQFNRMYEDEFSIINEIQNLPDTVEFKEKYEINNQISCMISVGAATKPKTSAIELGNNAQKALQIAINRGGNAAWLFINDSSKSIGKNQFFRNQNTLGTVNGSTSSILKKCRDYDNVFIVSHKVADADALGSMIAAFRLFKLYCKGEVKIVVDYDNLEDTTKKLYDYILEEPATKSEDYVSYKEVFITREQANEYDLSQSLLIICDTQSPTLLMYNNFHTLFKEYVVIDHHMPSDTSYPDEIDKINPLVSSTVEVFLNMYRFADKIKNTNNQDNAQGNEEFYHITREEANVMLTGLVVDTASFTYRTSSLTFECVTTLANHGADMIFVRRILRDDVIYEREIGKAIESADYSKPGFAIAYVDSNDRTLIAKIADRLLTIDNIRGSFSIGHFVDNENDCYILSARSYNDFNVEEIFKDLGGGGHHQAAGCAIPNAKIKSITKQELVDKIIEEISLTEGELVKVVIMKDDKEYKLGELYQTIELKSGFANKLIKDGIVERLTPELEKRIKKLIEEKEANEAKQRDINSKLKEQYDGKEITMTMKIGKDGRSMGSDITADKIAKELEKENFGTIDKKNIHIVNTNKITSIGDYTIIINISKDEKAKMTVRVIEA